MKTVIVREDEPSTHGAEQLMPKLIEALDKGEMVNYRFIHSDASCDDRFLIRFKRRIYCLTFTPFDHYFSEVSEIDGTLHNPTPSIPFGEIFANVLMEQLL